MVNGIDKIWAADLADMKAFEKDNDGYTFLLLVKIYSVNTAGLFR